MLRRPLAALALVAAFPLADTMAAARQTPRRIIHFNAFDDKGRAVTDFSRPTSQSEPAASRSR